MEDITVEELKQRMDNGTSPMVIDVREPFEFEEFNIGAKLIPLGSLPGALDDLEEYKDAELVVHCKSGGRSANAKAFLQSVGFKNVRNLLGGVTDWKAKFN